MYCRGDVDDSSDDGEFNGYISTDDEERANRVRPTTRNAIVERVFRHAIPPQQIGRHRRRTVTMSSQPTKRRRIFGEPSQPIVIPDSDEDGDGPFNRSMRTPPPQEDRPNIRFTPSPSPPLNIDDSDNEDIIDDDRGMFSVVEYAFVVVLF